MLDVSLKFNLFFLSIPIYYVSTILFSKTFVDKLTATIRKFWWTGVQEDNPTNSIAYMSWGDICQSKENEGLEIRDLPMVNKSLIIHAAYNIVTNKNLLLSAVLKAKYYHNYSFWVAPISGPKSAFWSSILQVRQDLISNIEIQIHEGDTSIWSAPSVTGTPFMTISFFQ